MDKNPPKPAKIKDFDWQLALIAVCIPIGRGTADGKVQGFSHFGAKNLALEQTKNAL